MYLRARPYGIKEVERKLETLRYVQESPFFRLLRRYLQMPQQENTLVQQQNVMRRWRAMFQKKD